MFNKIMLIEQVTIQEKKQSLINKGISQDIIDNLLQQDSTNKNKTDNDKVGSYTDWIVSRYLKDREFNNFDKLHQQLQQYDKSKHKIPDKQMQNIGQFNSLNELIDFVNNNQDKLSIETNKFIVKSESGYDTFYSRDFIIQVPHTKEQSIKLGSGTKWCTSQINDNMFNEYYIVGYLFYITNKTKNQERYNLFLNLKYISNGDPIIEFADDKDRHLPYKLFNIVKQDNTLIPQIKKYFEYKNVKVTKQLSAFLDCNDVYDIVQWYKQNIFKKADIYFETDEQKIINILSYNIGQYIYISNPTHQIQLQQVKENANQIKYIENPDKDIQLQQVNQDGYQIHYIKDPDKDVQMQQIKENEYQIGYIKNPDKEVQMQQVNQNVGQIQHIKNPDKEVQMQQVKQYSDYIQYIKNPDKDVQLYQVSKNGFQIYYIENPDKDVQLQQVKRNGDQVEYILEKGIIPDKDIWIQQVSNSGYQIKHIKNPDKELQLQQVSNNGYQIEYIENPDKEVQLQQVSQTGYQIYYIKNPDKDIQMQQVTQSGEQIKYIDKPDKEVQLQQVSQDGQQIRFITNPNKDIQLQQIKQYPKQYSYIKNPDPEQTQLYKQLTGIKESASYINKLLDVN